MDFARRLLVYKAAQFKIVATLSECIAISGLKICI